MADVAAALDRLSGAGVPWALAGSSAVDALLGRDVAVGGGVVAVAVPPGVVDEVRSRAGGAVLVEARPLADGDVVERAVAGRRVPCLRPEIVLTVLVDTPGPPPVDVVADARALAATAGLSLPPPFAGAASPAPLDGAVEDRPASPAPPDADAWPVERGDAVAGRSPAPPASGGGSVERGDAVAGRSPAPPVLVPSAAMTDRRPSSPVVVRDAVPADAVAIAVVHVASWRAGYAGHMPADFLAGLNPVSRWRQWSARLTSGDPAGHVLVAGPPGVVEAFAVCGPSPDGGPGAELVALYCHPAAWGTGRGRALLAVAEDRLRGDGEAEATLWVLAGNDRAIRFYEAAGWSPDGTARSDEVGPPGDRITVDELRYHKRLV
jgi:GNAT superfamily N-acetyltransferase